MAEPKKKTVMVLKVDLQCPRCYKKIQKILCRIPQIRDRAFDEKENTVTITVTCCSPEKIRDKLCSKGGKIITGIEIREEPLKEKPKSNGKVNAPPPDAPDPKPPTNPAPEPPVRLPPVYPVNPCCCSCYHGYGFPPPPPQPCCNGNCAWGLGYLYGRPPCYVTRRCDYFSEENATGCRIM